MARFLLTTGQPALPDDPSVQNAIASGNYTYDPATDTYTINTTATGTNNRSLTTPVAGNTSVVNTTTKSQAANAGYGNEIAAREQTGEESLQKLRDEGALQRQKLITDQAQREAELRARTDKELAELNNAAERRNQEAEAQLQRDLQAGRITSAELQQQRELAQRETEYARSLAETQLKRQQDEAFRQLQETHSYEMQKLNFDLQQKLGLGQLDINRSAEARAGAELEARLAANPLDFVTYELFKRGQGRPVAGTQLGQGLQPQALPGGNELDTGQGATAGTNPYAQYQQPAYSDQTLQEVSRGLFNPSGAAYNPNLKGRGIFGMDIQAPNQMSGREFYGLSGQQLGMLSSILRAGVDVGGKRVSVDPEEYFTQVGRSFVPTLQGAGNLTQYRGLA